MNFHPLLKKLFPALKIFIEDAEDENVILNVLHLHNSYCEELKRGINIIHIEIENSMKISSVIYKNLFSLKG